MTDVNPTPAGSEEEPAGEEPTIIRDRRRIDPETGEVRTAAADSSAEESVASEPAGEGTTSTDAEPSVEPEGPDPAALQDELLREKAARHNERERFKRERSKDRDATIGTVVESLLPVMDDIHSARQHGDLEGTPFEKIADKLEATLGRYGVESIGAVGDSFDPMLHEALMHVEAEVPEGSEGTTVVQVIQPGFKIGDRVVRPARVSVADPA